MPANIGESMRFLSARNVEIDVNWCFIEGKKKCNVRSIHEMVNKKNISNFARVAISGFNDKVSNKVPKVDKLYNWLLELLRTNTHRCDTVPLYSIWILNSRCLIAGQAIHIFADKMCKSTCAISLQILTISRKRAIGPRLLIICNENSYDCKFRRIRVMFEEDLQ